MRDAMRPMTLAVMQPYLFPYLGYFQLIAAVDRFVIYDDVSYIRRGWINRNRWLVGGASAYFTFPVRHADSFGRIADVRLVEGNGWAPKLLRTFRHEYGRAPYFAAAFELLERVVTLDEPIISRRAMTSVRAVMGYLRMTTPLVETSARYENADLRAADRIIDICRREGATRYVNAIGGQELYDVATFAASGIELQFLRSLQVEYRQFRVPFVPWLSILDVIAFNPPDVVSEFLLKYVLV
jgi:WbqC-like protein family